MVKLMRMSGSVLKRLYGRVLPLRMLFQSNLLRFHHLDSFKDFCGNRVSLPANRMHELPSLGKGDLQQQLDMLKEARQRLLKCLITTELQPGLYLPEARIFSKDNAWRDVMRALRGATGGRRLHAGAVRPRVALLPAIPGAARGFPVPGAAWARGG